MRKAIYLSLLILLTPSVVLTEPPIEESLQNNSSFENTKETDAVEIKIGMRPSAIKEIVGAPLQEKVVNRFWGVKEALYKISEKEFCIIRYRLGRAAHVAFLENVTFFEAKQQFESSIQ